MTIYYIGYVQGNDEYVYVGNITPTNVGIVTSTDSALEFKTEELASGVATYISSLVANQDFKILKITKTIEEV